MLKVRSSFRLHEPSEKWSTRALTALPPPAVPGAGGGCVLQPESAEGDQEGRGGEGKTTCGPLASKSRVRSLQSRMTTKKIKISRTMAAGGSPASLCAGGRLLGTAAQRRSGQAVYAASAAHSPCCCSPCRGGKAPFWCRYLGPSPNQSCGDCASARCNWGTVRPRAPRQSLCPCMGCC